MNKILAAIFFLMTLSVNAANSEVHHDPEKKEFSSSVRLSSSELEKILKNSDFYALSLMLNTGVPEIYRVLIETIKIKHVIAVENDLKELIEQQKETNIILRKMISKGN